MQTGYYILSGVSAAAGSDVLTATGIQVPGAASEAVNFISFVGPEGSEGTPAGFLLQGPAGQSAIAMHSLTATTLKLALPWAGADVVDGTALLVPGLNALPIGAHALKILQMITQGGLRAADRLADYLGDPIAQSEVQTNIGISTFIKTLLDNADAGTARTTLGAQAAHGNLAALAGLSLVADRLVYGSDAGTLALAPLTAFARTLLDDIDASAALSTLGVSAFIKTLLDDADASDALSTLGVSAFIKTLLDDASAGSALTTLGVSAFAKTLLDDTDAAMVRATIGAQAALTPVHASGGATLDLPGGAANDRLSVSFVKGAGSMAYFTADVEVSRTVSGVNYAYIALILRNLTDGTTVAQTQEVTLPLEYVFVNHAARMLAVNSLVPGKTYQVSILGRASAPAVANSSQMYIAGVHG